MPSVAPYNFIPLNKKVVKAEEIPHFDKYHEDRFNGYIELTINTKTPLFIRGEGSNFFSAGGKVKLPGSSLRGMVRTLVEITSYGKFHFFEEGKRFYYRWIAEPRHLRKYYFRKMRNVKGGYLVYEKKRFIIRPAIEDNGQSFREFSDPSRIFDYERQENGSWKVWTGNMYRKRKNWIIYRPNQNADEIPLPEEVINYYKNDINRKILPDLLESARRKNLVEKREDGTSINILKIQFPDGVPIFYTKYTTSGGNDLIAFGHTKNFRLPYEYIIGDHIPNDLKSENVIDITEAIFGKESRWQTRVFFEDAELLDDKKDIFLKETSPNILASPKPTCFQQYLEQPQGNNTNKNNLKHWDDKNAKIRGHKLYWHRDTPEQGRNAWNEGQIKNDELHTKIKAIKPGVNFMSKIRFENLSKVELGAVLFVLDLPKNCYHKLGMAKPLGLGSIQIIPKLLLIDRKARYGTLFEGDNWLLGLFESKVNEFTKEFENYILDRIASEDKEKATKLWNVPRLKAFTTMLNWNNVKQHNWLEKTRYMKIDRSNEFKNRPVLPKPDNINREE